MRSWFTRLSAVSFAEKNQQMTQIPSWTKEFSWLAGLTSVRGGCFVEGEQPRGRNTGLRISTQESYWCILTIRSGNPGSKSGGRRRCLDDQLRRDKRLACSDSKNSRSFRAAS